MKLFPKLLCAGVLGTTTMLVAAAGAQATDSDKKFLATAAQADVNEIKLSELAAKKASDQNVRDFARTMVTQHREIEAKMKPFADQWGLTAPADMDSDHQKEYDKLSKLSGKAFDKEYMAAVDKDHHKAEGLFTDEIKSTNDQQFKQAVMDSDSAVVAHTNMADDLKSKIG